METRARTLVKTLVYRCWVLFSTMMLFILTGKSFDEALVPTIIVNCVWMFSYYLYERIWTHIDWGKEKNDSKKPFVNLEKNVVLNNKRKK